MHYRSGISFCTFLTLMGKQQQHIRIHSASNDLEGPEVKDEPTTDVIKPSVKRDEKTAT